MRRFIFILPLLTLACTLGGALQAPTRPTVAPLATAAPTPTVPRALEYSVPDEGTQHIAAGADGEYDHYPPSSGEHYGQVADWGIYSEPVPPEYWVHNLEHGGIVLLYQCAATCPEIEDQLTAWLKTVPTDAVFNSVKLVVSPNARIGSSFIALAWGHELDLSVWDGDRLLEFYETYVNQGPELVP